MSLDLTKFPSKLPVIKLMLQPTSSLAYMNYKIYASPPSHRSQLWSLARSSYKTVWDYNEASS